MQEAIEMATELMDRRINTLAERQTENKRKFEDAPRNNQNQQPNKRQNTGRAYAAGNGDKKSYEGTKPLCPKCNFNHYGPCIPKCTNCKKLGHLAKDCRSRPATANNNNNNRNNNNNNNRNNNNPRAQGANTNAIVCFECGAPGHFRKNCPQWKNKNQGNGNGVARAYAVGVAGQNPDNNVVTGTFLLNNRCASILFDTGADRSFVSTQFSALINITPTTLDHGYNVELADGRIIWVNTENWRQVEEEATARCTDRQKFFLPRRLARLPPIQTSGNFHIDLVTNGAVLVRTLKAQAPYPLPHQNERIGGSTTRAFATKVLYKDLVHHKPWGAPVLSIECQLKDRPKGQVIINLRVREEDIPKTMPSEHDMDIMNPKLCRWLTTHLRVMTIGLDLQSKSKCSEPAARKLENIEKNEMLEFRDCQHGKGPCGVWGLLVVTFLDCSRGGGRENSYGNLGGKWGLSVLGKMYSDRVPVGYEFEGLAD
ncbi:putative reverse transcriptase domain-containing protein [Tanacetum coccineum]